MSVLSLSFAKDFAASGTPLLNLAQLESETQLCIDRQPSVADRILRRVEDSNATFAFAELPPHDDVSGVHDHLPAHRSFTRIEIQCRVTGKERAPFKGRRVSRQQNRRSRGLDKDFGSSGSVSADGARHGTTPQPISPR
jgi:hypothetical protein